MNNSTIDQIIEKWLISPSEHGSGALDAARTNGFADVHADALLRGADDKWDDLETVAALFKSIAGKLKTKSDCYLKMVIPVTMNSILGLDRELASLFVYASAPANFYIIRKDWPDVLNEEMHRFPLKPNSIIDVDHEQLLFYETVRSNGDTSDDDYYPAIVGYWFPSR